MKICCFTGHRPNHLPWRRDEWDKRCIACKQLIQREIESAILDGYQRFLCGMAEGIDLYCAEAVLKLQKKYSAIRLTAVIPCADQTRNWTAEVQERYQEILKQIGEENCVVLHTEYTPRCMMERNLYMVNLSERMIAVYDGKSKGGTLFTLLEGIQRGTEITLIDPEDSTVERINHL